MKCRSRWVRRTSALDPEKPVRYRMFGRLVSTSASMCAAMSDSLSAATRAARRSAIGGALEALHQSAQSELIPVGAEAADHRQRRIGQRRVTPLGLARIDVGDVQLDERHADSDERVANRQAGVGVRRGVYHRA